MRECLCVSVCLCMIECWPLPLMHSPSTTHRMPSHLGLTYLTEDYAPTHTTISFCICFRPTFLFFPLLFLSIWIFFLPFFYAAAIIVVLRCVCCCHSAVPPFRHLAPFVLFIRRSAWGNRSMHSYAHTASVFRGSSDINTILHVCSMYFICLIYRVCHRNDRKLCCTLGSIKLL